MPFLVPEERSEPYEANESIDAAEPADPIESSEPALPIDPIESTEPAEPIESTDPSLATESTDPVDLHDQCEMSISILGSKSAGGPYAASDSAETTTLSPCARRTPITATTR